MKVFAGIMLSKWPRCDTALSGESESAMMGDDLQWEHSSPARGHEGRVQMRFIFYWWKGQMRLERYFLLFFMLGVKRFDYN